MRDYFQEAITAALSEQDLRPEADTTTYLVELLCRFARSGPQLALPLAPALARAKSCPDASQSIRQLRQVGDQSLYVAGFFSDSLRRSDLDQSYYSQIGSTAYQHLSRSLRLGCQPTRLVIVFSELGTSFDSFVELLSLVKLQGVEPTDEELGQLYARWLETGDDTAARRLRRAGMVVLERPRTKQ